jgi:small conductance mechanosensitive channel
MDWMQALWVALTIAGVALGGYLLMKFFRYEAKHLAQRASKSGILDQETLKWIEELLHGIRVAVVAVVAILIVFFTLRLIEHPSVEGWNLSLVMDWLMAHGIRIILLLVGAYLVIKVVHVLVSKMGMLIRPIDDSAAAEIERQKRAQTISAIAKNVATAVVCVVTGLMLLTEIGINTTPVLASLGVIGVALGFGAQQLVGDLIAGFFHIFENQIRVGDVAVINGTGGLVEEIRLRTTILRGLDGTVHTFRNGSINTLSNMTKDYSYFLMDLGVAYKEDTDKVCEVVRAVGADMQNDETFSPSILEPVEILGVNNFADSAVEIKLRMKTIPIQQWAVGREFRRRLKYALDAKGIEIPFPHQTIYFGEASRPFQVEMNSPEHDSQPAARS